MKWLLKIFKKDKNSRKNSTLPKGAQRSEYTDPDHDLREDGNPEYYFTIDEPKDERAK